MPGMGTGGNAPVNEMLKTIEPKSDQLNADDLLGGRTITVKITKVSILAGEQPVALHYEGDNGKPYKPCKSMRRVIVTVWGSDANLYAGRIMTLYRDDEVQFGGVAVGGLRISHMSGIGDPVTIALTVTRARRKPFTVVPLMKITPESRFDYLAAGHAAAEEGRNALEAFWKSLSIPERQKIGAPQLESWKRTAASALAGGNGDPPHDPETGEIVDDEKNSRIDAQAQLNRDRGEGSALFPRTTNDAPNMTAAVKEVPANKPVPSDEGGLAAEHRQQKDAVERPLGAAAASDPKLEKLLDEAYWEAERGASVFKEWEDRLPAPDHSRMEPHLAGFRKQAAEADGGRG